MNILNESKFQANVIKEDFKMLVVRRKLSSIPNDPDDYDFDTDFDTNSATAESYIDETGDTGVGLFLYISGGADSHPQWEDFNTYGTTCPVISDLVVSEKVEDDYGCGNVSQNAGQTNWYVDLRKNAVNWLPQYSNSGIEPIDNGYVYSYDCWVTPYKFYRFGLWMDSGKVCFKWYGNNNLVTPDISDGGEIFDAEVSKTTSNCALDGFNFLNYYGTFPFDMAERTYFDEVKRNNIYFLPCRMDDKIALNINFWYYNTTQNNIYSASCACSNSYRDDTMVSGGKEENDLNYDGILRKYYGQEGDMVSGDIPEPVFEERPFALREMLIDADELFNGVGTDSITLNQNVANNMTVKQLHNIADSDCWVDNFAGDTISDVEVDGTNYARPTNLTDENKANMVYGQFAVPNDVYPPNYRSSTWYTIYNPRIDDEEVGTYLKTGISSGSYIRSYGISQVIAPSTASNKKGLDGEFNIQVNTNQDAVEQMMTLNYKNDGKIHLYFLYLNEEDLQRPVIFGTYYNPNYKTEVSENPININNYSPYYIFIVGEYGDYTGEQPLQYFKPFGLAVGDADGFRDDSMQQKRPNDGLTTFPICHNQLWEASTPYCHGLGQDPEPIHVWICEYPYTLDNSSVYIPTIAFTPNKNNRWEFQVGAAETLEEYYGSFVYGSLGNVIPIENPMVKNETGKIDSPNENENQGEGSNSTNPDDRGSHDNRVIDTPKVPPKTTNILASGLLSMYIIDNENLRKLGSDLFSDNVFQQIQVGVSKPLDCVLRIAESRISPQKESSDRAIKLGSANISARGTRITKDIKTVDCGSTYIARRNGDYTDCQEKLQIYLPFIGYRDLDGNYLQNKRVYLIYKFNFLNGKCIANIYVSNPNGKKNEQGKALYQTYNGDFITTFPLGTMSNTGMLSMLMSAGLGAISHNMYYARAAVRSLPNALVPQAEHTGEFGANNATLINELTPCIHRWKLNHTWSEKSGDITGEVSYKRLKLSEAKKGYIKCKNFELSTIPDTITKDECEKIKELLNNGVWKE